MTNGAASELTIPETVALPPSLQFNLVSASGQSQDGITETVKPDSIVLSVAALKETTPKGADASLSTIVRNPSTGSINIPDLLRSISKATPGILTHPDGAAEAIPSLRGDAVAAALDSAGFKNLHQVIPGTAGKVQPWAISGADDSRRALTHAELAEFLHNGARLGNFGISVGDRCAMLLPNGPEIAVCLLACVAQTTCVPINYQQTTPEIRTELQGTKSKAIVVPASEDPQRISEIVDGLDVVVIKLHSSSDVFGLFQFGASELGTQPSHTAEGSPLWNGPEDNALILHTSGTSGTKKMVPYTLKSLVVGAACIIESWQLSNEDVCLNMMPLFHIGGISRNICGSILAGGAVVCAPAFDASQFWDCAQLKGVTWYYAGPTMHHMILEEHKSRGIDSKPLRFVANASGGLLVTLADRMRECFRCPVLPCYGMTECMPISAPPMLANLEYPASSGQMVGPSVRIADDSGYFLGVGEVGNIALKGAPLMKGYLDNEKANKEAFFPGGWFNTGDCGFLNEDGWITLTGRSKEVINRGGEIISPFEVEEAIIQHDRVKEVIAFSAPHDVLQEVVGVVIVPSPDKPRVSLASLQKYCSQSLHPSKWPYVIVFMDALPRGAANKAQRIKFASRTDMRTLTDSDDQMSRLFEAKAPPVGTNLSEKIPMTPVQHDLDKIQKCVEAKSGAVCKMKEYKHQGHTCAVAYVQLTWRPTSTRHSSSFLMHAESIQRSLTRAVSTRLLNQAKSPEELQNKIQQELHEYELPKEIISVESLDVSEEELPAPEFLSSKGKQASSETEAKILEVCNEVLGQNLGVQDDLFDCGCNSLLAGRLVANLRQAMNVPLAVSDLFVTRTVEALAAKMKALGGESGSPELSPEDEKLFKPASDERIEPCSPTAPAPLIVQLLPLILGYPSRRFGTWILFMYLWLTLMQQFQMSRLAALFVAIFLGRWISGLILPWVGILIKWLVIGRYKAGHYPIWGQYYLRWWFVDQMLVLCGKGFFRMDPMLLRTYYRLLGAKIGDKVSISKSATLTEFDLIDIGNSCLIDNVTLSAFAFDSGAMKLSAIKIGMGSNIPSKTIIVAGIPVPPNTHFSSLSSSYDIKENFFTEANKRYVKASFPKPAMHYQLFGHFIMVLVWAISMLPIVGVLMMMTLYSWYVSELGNFFDVVDWFLRPQRMGYYVAIRVVRAVIVPLLEVWTCILVKRLVVGKFTPGRKDRSQFTLFQHWLMAQLLPSEKLQEAAHLMGVHYRGYSFLLRALGSKIGERIYWPGSGFEGLVEYDLLTVEDDCVFGSRSMIMTSDAYEAKPITIEAGAFVGDRCCLQPGCTIGRNATLGSGGMANTGVTYKPGSTWVGSKRGRAVCLDEGSDSKATESTIRPFGRAMYKREASYLVLRGRYHGIMEACFRGFSAGAHALVLIGAFAFTAKVALSKRDQSTLTLLQTSYLMLPTLVFFQNCATLFFLLLAFALKLGLIGKRKVGSFNWDQSSYCQRWQVYLASTTIIRGCYFRRGILDYLQGSTYLVSWFRAHGATIGNRVCLYPRGADPMMTEPDLVTIGDKSCIDKASIIAHINSRGDFGLNQVWVGEECTLRANSRLLSGASMERGSTLLEHCLILGGDIVDQYSVWQGWPAEKKWQKQCVGVDKV